MATRILKDVQVSLNRAEREARRLQHPVIDTGHMLLGLLLAKGLGSATLAAFGVKPSRVRELLRHTAPIKSTSGVRLPPLKVPRAKRRSDLWNEPSLPFTRRAARAVERAVAFTEQRGFKWIDQSALLHTILADPESGAQELLARLEVDTPELCREARCAVLLEKTGQPRTSAYIRSLDRGPLGWMRRAYRLLRPPIRVRSHPVTHPVRLLLALAQRAVTSDGDDFGISDGDFAAWVPREVLSSRRFQPGATFRKVRDRLSEDEEEPYWITSMVPDWPDPATARGGQVHMWRAGEAIRIHVVKRWMRPTPAPQDQPTHVASEVAAAVRRQRRRRATITREQLRDYLGPRTLAHPQFDAGACFDELTALLDHPVTPRTPNGPKRWGGNPAIWLYTDGERIYAARWLMPWTRRWLRGRYGSLAQTGTNSPTQPDVP